MNKEILEEKIKNFNPSENGLHSHGIFGLPFGEEESRLVLVPVPWEATVSYGEGTSNGPKTILDASQQIDLAELSIYENGWKEGIAMQDIPSSVYYENKQVREKVSKYLDGYVKGEVDNDLVLEIDNSCESLKDQIKKSTEKLLKENKIVGVCCGGGHRVPLGYIEALSSIYKRFWDSAYRCSF